MRVAIDVSLLADSRTGIGSSLYHLLEAFGRIEDGPEIVPFAVFRGDFERRRASIVLPPYRGPQPAILRFPARLWPLAKLSGLSLQKHVGPIDLVHLTGFTFLSAPSASLVVTVYDLIHRIVPRFRGRMERDLFLSRALRRASRIIAISRQTSQDLRKIYRIEAGRIRIIPLGVDPRFRPDSKGLGRAALQNRGIVEPYLLYVGRFEPHKNVPLLVAAFRRLLEAGNVPPLRLVLVGPEGTASTAIQRAVEKNGLSERVVFPGPLSVEDLAAAYAGAEALVLPSSYEGFGLPVLEAMASGCPVVATRAGAIPEVAGSAALVVGPGKVEELIGALRKLLGNASLGRKLVSQGLERARLYSWDKTAQATCEVYREACTARKASQGCK